MSSPIFTKAYGAEIRASFSAPLINVFVEDRFNVDLTIEGSGLGASTTYSEDFDAVIDRDTSTFYQAYARYTYSNTWWRVDLGQQRTMRQVNIYQGPENRLQIISVQGSNDDENWTDIITEEFLPDITAWMELPFGADVTYQYIRIYSHTGYNTYRRNFYEVQVIGDVLAFDTNRRAFTVTGFERRVDGGDLTEREYAVNSVEAVPPEVFLEDDLSAGTLTDVVVGNTLSLAPRTGEGEGAELDSESFETDFGVWENDPTHDYDWARNYGTTGSSGTGPSSAYDGSYYIYVETTSVSDGQTSTIETDLTNLTAGNIDFWYHQYGAGQGTLYLEGWDGAEWVEIWSSTGNQGTNWINVSEDFFGYSKLRFRNVHGSSYTGDVALDLIVITANPYETSGNRVSPSEALTTYPNDIRIQWEETTDADTSITVETAVTGETGGTPDSPAEGDWAEQTSGELIDNIPAGDLTGQHLWIRETLTTTDTNKTPTLASLHLEESEAPGDQILITMSPYNDYEPQGGRFQNVEGDLTVAYDVREGNLAGWRGPVESFVQSFTPLDLVPIPRPLLDQGTMKAAATNLTMELHAVVQKDGFAPQENVKPTITSLSIVLAYVDEIDP